MAYKRRNLLKGIGALSASSPIVKKYGSRLVSNDSYIEIDFAARGDEVIRWVEVPERWWEHILEARTVRNQLNEEYRNFPGFSGTGFEVDRTVEINGFYGRKISVRFEKDVLSDIDIESKVNGISVYKDRPINIVKEECELDEEYISDCNQYTDLDKTLHLDIPGGAELGYWGR